MLIHLYFYIKIKVEEEKAIHLEMGVDMGVVERK